MQIVCAVKEFFFLVHSIVYLPHLLLYAVSPSRSIIGADVEAMCKTGIYSKRKRMRLLYILVKNGFFRKMFYVRLGSISNLVSWYSPGDKTFFPNKNIGKGIHLAHPYATILNAKIIGENFTCRQCTTIGNKFDGDKENLPTIGNNVTVGANVVIIGNIVIGDNVIIGAGSVVVKDIPESCVVAGNPAKVINNL